MARSGRSARRNNPKSKIRPYRSPCRQSPQSIVKESDIEVNQSHLNASKTRKIGHGTIQSRLPHSQHWLPPRSSYVITNDNLDKVPFSVGIDTEEDSHQICSICVINPPPENTRSPASIGAFATLVEHEGKGFGSAALKVALLYMKEHYVSRNVRVLADTFEETRRRSAITYWTNMGFEFSTTDRVIRKSGYAESMCLWMEAEIDEALARFGDDGLIACIIDAEEDSHPIRSICVINPPPENMTTPVSIAEFAILAEHEGKGFGSAELKVALLYMKEH
jgi:GNAT superfamily N-acetyltransferase